MSNPVIFTPYTNKPKGGDIRSDKLIKKVDKLIHSDKIGTALKNNLGDWMWRHRTEKIVEECLEVEEDMGFEDLFSGVRTRSTTVSSEDSLFKQAISDLNLCSGVMNEDGIVKSFEWKWVDLDNDWLNK